MSLIAITHTLSPKLPECELTHLERMPIDMDRARAEHEHYQQVLRSADYEVIEYSFNEAFPDSVFVEDTAIVGNHNNSTINQTETVVPFVSD